MSFERIHPSNPPSYADFVHARSSPPLTQPTHPSQLFTLALDDDPPRNNIYHRSAFYKGVHTTSQACHFGCESFVVFLPLYLLLVVAIVTAAHPLVSFQVTIVFLVALGCAVCVLYAPWCLCCNSLICLPCYSTCCKPYIYRYFTWTAPSTRPLTAKDRPVKPPRCLPSTACCYPNHWKIVESIMTHWALPSFLPLQSLAPPTPAPITSTATTTSSAAPINDPAQEETLKVDPNTLLHDLRNISLSSGTQQCVNWLHAHQQQQVRYIVRLETFRILHHTAVDITQDPGTQFGHRFGETDDRAQHENSLTIASFGNVSNDHVSITMAVNAPIDHTPSAPSTAPPNHEAQRSQPRHQQRQQQAPPTAPTQHRTTVRTIGNTIDNAHRNQNGTDESEIFDESSTGANQVMLMHIEDFELPLFNYNNSIHAGSAPMNNDPTDSTRNSNSHSSESPRSCSNRSLLPHQSSATSHPLSPKPTANPNSIYHGLGTPLIDRRHGISPAHYVWMVEKHCQQRVASVQIQDHLRVILPQTSIPQSSMFRGPTQTPTPLATSPEEDILSSYNPSTPLSAHNHLHTVQNDDPAPLPEPHPSSSRRSILSPNLHRLAQNGLLPTPTPPNSSTVDLSEYGEVESGLNKLMMLIGETYGPIFDPHSQIPITSFLHQRRPMQFQQQLEQRERELREQRQREEADERQRQRNVTRSDGDEYDPSPSNNASHADINSVGDEPTTDPESPARPRMMVNPHYGVRVTGYWYFGGEFNEAIEGEAGGIGYVSNLPQYLRYQKTHRSYTPLAFQHPSGTDEFGYFNNTGHSQHQPPLHHATLTSPLGDQTASPLPNSTSVINNTPQSTSHAPETPALGTFGDYHGDGSNVLDRTPSPFQVAVIKVYEANQAYKKLYDHYRSLEQSTSTSTTNDTPTSQTTTATTATHSPSIFNEYRFPTLCCPSLISCCVFTPLLYLLLSFLGWFCCLHYCFHRTTRHVVYPNYMTVYTQESYGGLVELVRRNRLPHRTVYRNTSLIGPLPTLSPDL